MADTGILHNELYDTAWSMILAIIFMPIVAPAKEIAKCVFDKDGNNYYDKKGIAPQNAVVPVIPCLEETAKEVKATPETKEEFLNTFKKKLEEAYAKEELHLDYSNYSGEYGSDLWKFLGDYYDHVLEAVGKK